MIRRILTNLYFLTFLNGFLLATLFYFKMEANYEKELFSAIHLNIDNKVKLTVNSDSLVVKVMHACNELLNNRAPVFEDQVLDGFKVDYLHPTSIDLMTAKGACGSYSIVLARLFKDYNLPVRIAQMKAKGIYGAHNVVEVKTNNGWAVLDPLFNVYFIKPGGVGLASFSEVKNNWNFYSHQLPANYDRRYRYEDVRYSNWDKDTCHFSFNKKSTRSCHRKGKCRHDFTSLLFPKNLRPVFLHYSHSISANFLDYLEKTDQDQSFPTTRIFHLLSLTSYVTREPG